MAEADFNALTSASNGALDAGNVSKGVTLAHPVAAGTFANGMHALTSVTGVAGFYTDLTDFNPLQDGSSVQKGGSIRCALRKQTVASDYAPFIALLSGLNVQTSSIELTSISS